MVIRMNCGKWPVLSSACRSLKLLFNCIGHIVLKHWRMKSTPGFASIKASMLIISIFSFNAAFTLVFEQQHALLLSAEGSP